LRCPKESNLDPSSFKRMHIEPSLPEHRLFALDSLIDFLFPHYRTHLSQTFFAESKGFPAWLRHAGREPLHRMNDVWLSRPLHYHSANSPIFCGERGNPCPTASRRQGTPEPFMANCFQDSTLDQPGFLHFVCMVRIELTHLLSQKRIYSPSRLSNFVACTCCGWRRARTFNQRLNKPLLYHWAIHPLLARRDSNPEPFG
jgi:hypothetical protein